MTFVRNTIATGGAGRRRLLAVLFALVPVLLPAIASADINGWDWLNPKPSAYQLWSVAFGDASTGVAVGQGASVLATTDGGATWDLRDSSLSPDLAPNFTFWRVRLIDSTNAVAVGGYVLLNGEVGAGIAHSSDGGMTWTSPADTLPDIDFSDAYFSDPQTGSAVGLDFVTFQPTISRTIDGGETWDTQEIDTYGFLKAIAFPQPDVGFAVGVDSVNGALLLGTTNGGDSWAPISIPASDVLNDIEFADSNVGVIVGNAGTVFTTSNGGDTWEPRTSGTSLDLHAVTFTDTGTIVAMGGDFQNVGVILTSTDGGVTWSPPESFDHSIEGAAFVDADNGTAVGYGGAMLRTGNAGQSWNPEQESVSPNGLFGVAFTDALVGTAVGGEGTILRTEDGGATWHGEVSGTDIPLLGVAAVDANVLMAVGGDLYSGSNVILGTGNGGAIWADLSPPDLAVPMIAVSCPTSRICTVVGACGKIVRTEDFGTSWTTQRDFDCMNLPNLEGVYFFDDQNGFAVGRDTILHTSDGGATWVPQPSPLGNIEGLHGITFVDADNGYIAAGSTADLGTILHTSNGGASWDVQRGDIATNVTSVSFANVNDGIAVTLGGDIYQTHDGGTTWNIHTPIFAHLWNVAYKSDTTAIAVGDSNYNAAILGFNDFSDRVFANGFDPN